MNQEQEVKSTGAMPGLESLVNSIKGLRFKVVKLSTYNSLQNQLKLKDTIISNNQTKINELDKVNESLLHDKKALRQRNEHLFAQTENLEKQIAIQNEMIENSKNSIIFKDNQIQTQADTIQKITADRLEALNQVNHLLNKIKRKDQPRNGGKFASKKR